MRKYSVAFETTTVDIWEVEASNQNEATMKATLLREQHITNDEINVDDGKSLPTHSHVTKMKLLPVKPTVVD